jgi:hypothetical protein
MVQYPIQDLPIILGYLPETPKKKKKRNLNFVVADLKNYGSEVAFQMCAVNA